MELQTDGSPLKSAFRKRYRTMALLLATIVLVMLMLVPDGFHAEASGTGEDGMTWTLDDEDVMTVSGTGGIYDSMNYPCEGVKRMIINEGVEGFPIRNSADSPIWNTWSFRAP